MKVSYTNKNTTLVYSKGATKEQIVEFIRNRISKRQIEIDRRQWIVDEYNRILEKQKQDQEWLEYIYQHPEFLSKED